ncbi:MAG: family 78 glycoside hydrolase catalytic domain [Acidimicrobiales bacterium]
MEDDPTWRWPARWRARLVWGAPPPLSVDPAGHPTIDHEAARSVVLLRRRIGLESLPEHVPARMTADSRYVLWINGIEVSRGPVRSRPERLHYDAVDLRPHLTVGDNVIAVLARHYGWPTPWWMPSLPSYGLGGGAFALEARLGDAATGDDVDDGGWLVTDRRWRARLADAWHQAPGRGLTATAPEWLDGRQLPAGWNLWGIDDGDWADATELGLHHVGYDGRTTAPVHPYGAILPRPIPPLTGEVHEASAVGAAVAATSEAQPDPVDQVDADLAATTEVHLVDPRLLPFPVVLRDEFDAAVVLLDLGQQVAGTVELVLEAPEGTIVDAKAAERMEPDGRLPGLQQHSGFRYVARGYEDRFETLDPIGMRYVGLSLRGTGQVTIQSLAVRERLHPRPSGPSFSCSDPLLDRIWAVGRRTVDLCAQDAYLDCPSREQRAWVGDGVVHQLVDLTTNPDWSLARWNVELAATPRPDGMLPMAAAGDFEWDGTSFIPDWALHWIHAVHNLAQYTGDRELIRELLPVAERVVRWFLPFRGDDGLLSDVTGWVIVDWSAVHTRGTSAVVNALWGRALREVRNLAELVGDQGRAEWAGALWVHLRKGFGAFWDPERELYVDHLLDGERQRPVSQHTNAAAVVARLTRGVDTDALMRRVIDPDRLVHASWLMPGRDAQVEAAGDMYRDVSYLLSGPAEPWWDVDHQIVAAQPFFRYVVHDALADAELADLIPAACRDWERLLERSPDTFSEVWFGGSHCHGWSATPTRDLVQHTLGITPATPGFGRVRIAPSLGDLTWAKGAAPSPHGLIHVDATTERLEIDSPVPADVVFRGYDTRVAPGRHLFE